MKPALLGTGLAVVIVLLAAQWSLQPQPADPVRTSEYATLRWDGPENTHLIRPNGAVEVLGAKFAGVKKPSRVDERSFFMNLAVNALAREGFELVAMTPDDYLFRRSLPR